MHPATQKSHSCPVESDASDGHTNPIISSAMPESSCGETAYPWVSESEKPVDSEQPPSAPVHQKLIWCTRDVLDVYCTADVREVYTRKS